MSELSVGDPASQYRYFLPIQTRVADSVPDVGTIFYYYADTIVNNYLFWYCGFGEKMQSGEAKHMMVHTDHNFRSKTNYPQVLLGAARVNRLGNSTVRYAVAFYEPKMDYKGRSPADKKDVLSELDITMHGRILKGQDLEVFNKLSENYYSEPSLFGELVHTFLDENDRPLKTLPEYIQDGMMKIFVPQPKL